MAIGDVTQKSLLNKVGITTTPSENTIIGQAGKKITATSITLLNTSTPTVDVLVNLNGITIAAINLPRLYSTEILTGLDYIIDEGQYLSFSASITNIVNIAVMGIEEVIS